MLRRCPLAALFLAATCAAQIAPRVVDLTAPDGTRLKATYYAAARSGPAVMLLHQCNADRTKWEPLAQKLAAAGIHALALDFRGFGESGGARFGDQTPQERQQAINDHWAGDVDTAFQYLVSQPNVQREHIGAAGASCGVNQSLHLAERHAEVKSLVLLSGPADKAARVFLRKADLPVLNSASDDDGNAVEGMHWLVALGRNPDNQVMRFATGGHGTEMFAPHPELVTGIVSWFGATLRGNAAHKPGKRADDAGAFLASLDEPDGVARAQTMLAEAKNSGKLPAGFSEGVINLLGYERLTNGDNEGAITLFKINVEQYPQSANVYDSLGDGYLAAGQTDLAHQLAEKAIQQLAADKSINDARRDAIRQSAQQKLDQLAKKP